MAKATYIADFETANHPVYNGSETWVWLGVAVDYSTGETACVAHNIEEFMAWLFSLKKGAKLYFHNLAFDGSFILSYLMTHGYKPYTGRSKRNRYEVICDRFNKIFSLKIYYVEKNRKTPRLYTIYDSLRIIPMSERDMGKAFSLSTQKGEIEYTDYRPKGYIATQEEVDYCVNDCRMVAEALNWFDKNGWLEGYTISMIAFKEFKKTLPNWRYYMPLLSDDEDFFCRKAYRGGIAYANPRFAEKEVGEGQTFDANSLYPSQMLLEDMPMGRGMPFTGAPEDNGLLWIAEVNCTFEVKKNKLPMLQLKNVPSYSGNPREFVKRSYTPLTLTMCSVDWQTFNECYSVYDVKFLRGYYYLKKNGLFTPFIEKFGGLKTHAPNPQIKTCAKLIINSTYGRFALNPYRESKSPYMTPDGIIHWITDSFSRVEGAYIPVAVFTTAYGRQKLARVVNANYSRFLYCDTDSIHMLGLQPPRDIPVDDVELGYWKQEAKFKRAKYLHSKCYIEELYKKDGSGTELNIKIAGLPYKARDQVDFDNFRVGAVYQGKLARKSVKGGVILYPTTFEIKGASTNDKRRKADPVDRGATGAGRRPDGAGEDPEGGEGDLYEDLVRDEGVA